jgi:hypothetical protein
MIAAILCFLLALLVLVQFVGPSSASGPRGLFAALCWVGLGIGLLMRQSEDKRAFETGSPQSGPGLLVVGISAALLGVVAALGLFGPTGSGFSLLRQLLYVVFWLGAGALAIAASQKKGPPATTTLKVAGGVLCFFGLLAFYDLVEWVQLGVTFKSR